MNSCVKYLLCRTGIKLHIILAIYRKLLTSSKSLWRLRSSSRASCCKATSAICRSRMASFSDSDRPTATRETSPNIIHKKKGERPAAKASLPLFISSWYIFCEFCFIRWFASWVWWSRRLWSSSAACRHKTSRFRTYSLPLQTIVMLSAPPPTPPSSTKYMAMSIYHQHQRAARYSLTSTNGHYFLSRWTYYPHIDSCLILFTTVTFFRPQGGCCGEVQLYKSIWRFSSGCFQSCQGVNFIYTSQKKNINWT